MLGDGPSGFSQGWRRPDECGFGGDMTPEWVLELRSNGFHWTRRAIRLWALKSSGYRNTKAEKEALAGFFPGMPKEMQDFVLEKLREEHRWTQIENLKLSRNDT